MSKPAEKADEMVRPLMGKQGGGPEMKRGFASGGEGAGCFNPIWLVLRLWGQRELIRQLAWREVVGRYKGSFVGLGWSFIQPLLMLGVYTFVFSVIFNARWGTEAGAGESRAVFALALYMGLITFNIFAEVANGAPSLILANPNYVKKVVFPLEILPVVRLLSVLTNALFSLLVLIIGLLLVYQAIPWTALLLPVAWLPLLLFTLGCGYLLAALGVFVRDVEATIGILTTMLLFLSPIFYPISLVPERFRVFSQVNPLAIFVEASRRVMLWGQVPDWSTYSAVLALSLLWFVLGAGCFMKLKKAFADVI